jgi:N,N'-diacetyllegionaminate synthase
MKKIKYIAELCQNHNGREKNLDEMLDRCVRSGADYVKLQYIFSKSLAFRPIFETGFLKGNKVLSIKRPYKSEFNRLKNIELKNKVYEKFVTKCEKLGVKPMITCFSRDNVNTLYNMGYKDIKVASYDCSSFEMIREMSNKFDNIVMSTGATYLDEISKSCEILMKSKKNFSLLHCVTIYPTPINKINLKKIDYLKKKFNVPVGFSDHSESFNKKKNLASKLSIYFGAQLIERHITILPKDMSKDGKVSILPEDILEIKKFSKLKKNEQKIYLKDMYNFDIKHLKDKKLDLDLSHEELLNRHYYKGRFGSVLKNKRIVYNWDEVSLS